MIALQESDVNGLNSGSFQDIFNATAAEIGSTVRSGNYHYKMQKLQEMKQGH